MARRIRLRSVEEREAANQLLKTKGEFKDGIYTWYDESGKSITRTDLRPASNKRWVASWNMLSRDTTTLY